MDIAQFRLDMPEFTDVVAYPTTLITFWSTVAEQQLRICVWKDLRPFAVKLYVAHEITLARQNAGATTVGGPPGQSNGIANSKTVGGVSVSYDAALQSEKDAGWWNRTIYGMQLFRLMKQYGAGCVQL